MDGAIRHPSDSTISASAAQIRYCENIESVSNAFEQEPEQHLRPKQQQARFVERRLYSAVQLHSVTLGLRTPQEPGRIAIIEVVAEVNSFEAPAFRFRNL